MAQKVLFINQEVIPYVPDSAMSNLGRKLPAAIVASGSEIRTFMPRWGNVNERRNQLHEVQRLSGMNINIDDTDHPLLIKVASIAASHMQVYFIDNSDYFTGRLMREDEHGNEYSDNVERTIFYARGILETVRNCAGAPTSSFAKAGFATSSPSTSARLLRTNRPLPTAGNQHILPRTAYPPHAGRGGKTHQLPRRQRGPTGRDRH